MKSIIAAILLAVSFSGLVYADDDTYIQIQEMMNDLGGSPSAQKKNNGKTRKCASGGTKKITVKSSNNGTEYSGIYKNCREYGRQRDGQTTITIGGGDDEDSQE